MELIVWLIVYYLISLAYRYLLTVDEQIAFEDVISMSYKYADQIPLTFMLGFYVTQVVQRWWCIYMLLVKVDNIALAMVTYFPGLDEPTRMLRRTVVRLLVLNQALVFRNISTAVRKRFPGEENLVTAGGARNNRQHHSTMKKYYLPAHWIMGHFRRARDEGRIVLSDVLLSDLFKRVNDFRAAAGTLTDYDSTPLPLVYTQVVYLTVRIYFIVALVGRQYVINPTRTTDTNKSNNPIDLWVPFLTMLQFIFYVGWLKVAEALLNPFGEDDDDLELNWTLDRNLQVGMKIVDDAMGKDPPLVRDMFWDDVNAEPLYTEETANQPSTFIRGSAAQGAESPEEERAPMIRKRTVASLGNAENRRHLAEMGRAIAAQKKLENGSIASVASSNAGSPIASPIRRDFGVGNGGDTIGDANSLHPPSGAINRHRSTATSGYDNVAISDTLEVSEEDESDLNETRKNSRK